MEKSIGLKKKNNKKQIKTKKNNKKLDGNILLL